MAVGVTIATITADRRDFFSHTIHNVRSLLLGGLAVEWVIVEDGSDSVEDLVADISYVQYIRLRGKNSVGLKRNVANRAARGEFILFLDDDNFAFPHRLTVAVNCLSRSSLPMAGSSDMLILDGEHWRVFQVGPFSEMHATLGTWCIKRGLLEHTKFADDDYKGEEVAFTKDWSVPILQLGALNTSISFSHQTNTVDKKKLYEDWTPLWRPDQFISDDKSLRFFRSKSKKTGYS